jgi:hypothetical protein
VTAPMLCWTLSLTYTGPSTTASALKQDRQLSLPFPWATDSAFHLSFPHLKSGSDGLQQCVGNKGTGVSSLWFHRVLLGGSQTGRAISQRTRTQQVAELGWRLIQPSVKAACLSPRHPTPTSLGSTSITAPQRSGWQKATGGQGRH